MSSPSRGSNTQHVGARTRTSSSHDRDSTLAKPRSSACPVKCGRNAESTPSVQGPKAYGQVKSSPQKFVPYRTPGQSRSMSSRELARIKQSTIRDSGRFHHSGPRYPNELPAIWTIRARRRSRSPIVLRMDRLLLEELEWVADKPNHSWLRFKQQFSFKIQIPSIGNVLKNILGTQGRQ